MALLEEGRKIFDAVGSDDAESDYVIPWWRFKVFISLMAARLGAENLALQARMRRPEPCPILCPGSGLIWRCIEAGRVLDVAIALLRALFVTLDEMARSG